MAVAGGDRRLFVVNPTAHGGKGRASWFAILDRLSPRPADNAIWMTTHHKHAEEIAAAAQEVDTVVAVGGDGTVAEVLSGLMTRTPPRPRLAIIPTGTGNDIARQVGIPSVERALGLLERGSPRAHDLFRAHYMRGGKLTSGYGFIIATAGFSANPLVKPWMKRWLPPSAAYYLGVFAGILVYRPPRMVVRWPGGDFEGDTWVIAVANTEWAGGGSMRVAPGARSDDGRLDVTIMRSRGKLAVATRLLPRLARGTHIHEPGVSFFPATGIEIRSEPPAPVEIDGDLVGATPATIEVLPRAVEVLGPAA